ncbi:hypothetical protein EZS27_019980 [termite gut metagenome]|uniref:Sulfate exporter family transporter n=1 Tax=termite gut metagenome TaxID=433724 RepID=A0A5J4RD48_9ZZZZ
MSAKYLQQFKNEDWIATILGLVLVSAIILFSSRIPALPKDLSTTVAWWAIGGLFLISLLFSAVGVKLLGESLKGFIPAFLAIFAFSVFAFYLTTIPAIKTTKIETVFFAVAIGLIIRNTIGLPKWLSAAVKSEYYIKIGLVLLGTSVLFGEIMKAGALGLLQAVVVVFAVWYFAFWLTRKLKVDKEIGIMLASAVSICGVSAAIATCGAIKGDSKKLSFVISLVLVVAIPMMYLMPLAAKWIGLSQEVSGAWLGGTIDTTGAVVASGKFLGEVAEKYSVIIKSSQNVLLGVAAFIISIYWSLRGTNQQERPTAGVIWERFPKFVLGFILASLIFSFLIPAEQAKPLGDIAKGLREIMFSIAFICIGLETDFRFIFSKENSRNIWAFLGAQGFNIIITLGVAYLLFNVLTGEGGTPIA